MREYKIYKTHLGYGIYKKKEQGSLIELWFLGGNNRWLLEKSYAKIFYHIDDAISALTIMKVKDGEDRQDAG